MMTLYDTKQQISADPDHWRIHLMNFVDDFRYYRAESALTKPFPLTNPQMDALLASTVEYLCHELELAAPQWVREIPASPEPWFVSGMESLKAITLVETPVWFRMRKVFVLANFLSRA
ncbi:hypothetical protein QUF64_16395 [Anaerolineales bacterium HSG6]|nr:hypothetical protein [Anaerolineales bacterium HSG6]